MTSIWQKPGIRIIRLLTRAVHLFYGVHLASRRGNLKQPAAAQRRKKDQTIAVPGATRSDSHVAYRGGNSTFEPRVFQLSRRKEAEGPSIRGSKGLKGTLSSRDKPCFHTTNYSHPEVEIVSSTSRES